MYTDLCDRRTVERLMNAHGITFRKKYGQNFLIDPAVVEEIAMRCSDSRDTCILEIGPGIGTLTRELCERYRSVIALEIDKGLIPVLQETLSAYDNITLYCEDVMQADLKTLLAPAFAAGTVSVCANLPYYITTPILMTLLGSGLPFDSITVMIQKEVADRICSPAGGKAYGAITAAVAYYGHAQRLFSVPADRFMPPPQVTSTVIRIDLYRDKPYKPQDEKLLFRTIAAAFGQRRKTLCNALCAGFPGFDKETVASLLASCGFAADLRGERLDIADFVRLSDALFALGCENRQKDT